jgi:bla regulator protein blaR1
MNGLDLPTLGTLVATLGWTLLHFLWQGAVAGVLFGLALAVTARASALTRYRVACVFLALLAACPVITFFWLSPDYSSNAGVMELKGPATMAILTSAAASAASDWRALIDPWLPWAVLCWAAGVTFMTGRLLVEWREVRRLTQLDIEPLTAAWQRRVARLRASLGVRRAVRVLQSARVHVPLVIGWLKPVILVPVGAFAGLTPAQLELILMHELAHIRRNDYLINLVQVVVETLLFYHPVVRWVSRVLREERENCCDDLVVTSSGDALAYARALTELAGAQSLALQISVGSDGGKLLSRIKRIVAVREPTRVATHWSVGLILAAVGVSLSGLLHPMGTPAPRDESVPAITARAPVTEAPALAPTPEALPSEAMAQKTAAAPHVLTDSLPARAAAGSAVAPEPATAATQIAKQEGIPETLASSGASAAPAEGVTALTPPSGDTAALPTSDASEPAVANAISAAELTPTEPVRDAHGAAPSIGEEAPATAEMPVVKAISIQQPEFPTAARLSGIEGWVTVNYTIDEKGRVSDVRIVDAKPRKVFDSAVRKAVHNWRFEPTVLDGQPVARRMAQTIQFSLDYKMICNADASTGTRLGDRCRTKDEIERQGAVERDSE